MDVEHWIVTGWRGSGKTTLCREIIQYAQTTGWDVAGILSPAIFEAGIKTSINAIDLRTGEERPLAHVKLQHGTDLVFGNWFFNRQTLEWGNRVLRSIQSCDLLVVDELGPLEFNFSQGFVDALDILQSGAYHLAMVVIRPELLERASAMIHPTHTIHLSKSASIPSIFQQIAPRLDRIRRGS